MGQAAMRTWSFIYLYVHSEPILLKNLCLAQGLFRNSLCNGMLGEPSGCMWLKATPRESPWEPLPERFGGWFGTRL